MADIVDDFLTRLQQHIPNLPEHVPLQIERDIRANWGGNKPYVAKQVSRITRTKLVANGLRQGMPLGECFAQAGVARRTGYRILGSK